ncbi:hypothetical protein QYM36_012533 [Artemia franciscana]|uniref:Integrase catalytic domain-containing protein n=1 Tax=Artemia franciscana TaxID=6661 RepID=A0AA88HVJ5_ARTSF|nr:hypothetical protein QYM36_012533 [Artemia franciscana]
MYLVGLPEISKTGFKWMRVIGDYATRYPEAIPLRSTNSQKIADELIKFYPRVGIPSEILTDNGSNLISQAMQKLCVAPDIKHHRTSVYHPEMDGLVERLNGDYSAELRKFVRDEPKKWDQYLLYPLFAYRET